MKCHFGGKHFAVVHVLLDPDTVGRPYLLTGVGQTEQKGYFIDVRDEAQTLDIDTYVKQKQNRKGLHSLYFQVKLRIHDLGHVDLTLAGGLNFEK